MPGESLVQYDEFSRNMQAAGLDFSVTHNPWSLYLFEPRHDSLGYDGHHGWDTLQDPLHSLPAVRVRRHPGHDRRGLYPPARGTPRPQRR